MKKIGQYCICLFSFLFTTANTFGQDIHFSQFFEAPLLRNPALAGIFNGDLRFQAVYRTQWNSVTVPYQTVSLNGEYKLPVGNADDFITTGAQVLYDKAGTVNLTSTHVLPVINYHKSLRSDRNTYLSMGMMAGLVQRRFDRSRATTNNQYDGTGYNPGLPDGESFSKTNYTYFDGSVGMSFNSQVGPNEDNNFFIGLGYHHFNKSQKVSFYGSANELDPKWVGSVGVRFSINEYGFFTLHGDYSKQGPYTETIGGALYTWKLDDMIDPKYKLHAGAFLRWKDAFIPVVKVEAKPLAIAVSYDMNLSTLKTASQGRGGVEVSLTYQKFIERQGRTLESVRCPTF